MVGSSCASLCAQMQVLKRQRENARLYAMSSSQTAESSGLGKSLVRNGDLSPLCEFVLCNLGDLYRQCLFLGEVGPVWFRW